MVAKLFNQHITADLRRSAAATMHNAAERASPHETGGLLLGWWDGETIVIDDSVEVIDKMATGNSWTRHEKDAQSTLNTVIDRRGNPNLGYIGDWHSHPAPVGASSRDLKSLTRASAQYENPLALVVRLPNDSLKVYVANRGKLMNVKLTSSSADSPDSISEDQ